MVYTLDSVSSALCEFVNEQKKRVYSPLAIKPITRRNTPVKALTDVEGADSLRNATSVLKTIGN